MSGLIGNLLTGLPRLRRIIWRLGRRIYTSARREQIALEIESDGEAYLQAVLLRRALSNGGNLTVFDIGANQGDWVAHLLAQLPPELRAKKRLRVECFEPVPSSRERLKVNLAHLDPLGLYTVHSVAMSNAYA